MPPPIEFFKVGFKASLLKIKRLRLTVIRKIDRKISRNLVSINLLMKDPTITNTTAGIPMVKTSLRLNPFRKRKILVRLLET
jgi:hypothetical protein